MGAETWQHESPWQPDPAAALSQLQCELFQRKYNFAEELDRHHESAVQAVQMQMTTGDRHGLLAIYSGYLAVVEEIASAPLPATTADQIAALRRILASVSPDGFRGILDVVGIDDSGDVNTMRRLSAEDARRITGTEKPSRATVAGSVYHIAAELSRGESVAVTAFEDLGTPVSWFFIGKTTD